MTCNYATAFSSMNRSLLSYFAMPFGLLVLLAAIAFPVTGHAQTSSTRVAAAASGAEGQEPYRIESGDRLSVDVYREPDLSLQAVKVRDDGTIPFPLLGDIEVKGLTSGEIETLLTRSLADGYLKKPHVRVSIDAYRLYYITGEVQRPGGYSFLNGLTIEKAVVLAGGFTERASRSDIKLARDRLAGKVIEKAPVGTPIEPGDVITVGESFF